MPFDGQDQKPEIQILDRMRELLATSDRWCKGALNAPSGARCLMGAFYEVNGPVHSEQSAGHRVFHSLKNLTGTYKLHNFNDAPTTSHSDVLALIDAARERIINETTL